MTNETKETIDYASSKLDNFFNKVVTDGSELTNEFVAYSILELQITFIAVIVCFIIGTVSLAFLYIKQELVKGKIGDGIIVATVVSLFFVIVGLVGICANTYSIYMASKYPLMWVISNKIM